MSKAQLINVGKVSGVFGVKGWVKIFSFTNPRENIINYSPWLLKKGIEERQVKVVDGVVHSKAVLAQLDGINDRNLAAKLMGWDVFISLDQLPEVAKDEYYWYELIGLSVETNLGAPLGVVDSLLETGANDVLIVKGERERAIPFIQGQTILSIDLEGRRVIVDWEPDF